MPLQHLRLSRQDVSTDCLARAIANIERQIEQCRHANTPAPLNAYRARRILKEAQARCREQGRGRPTSFPTSQAARPDAMPKPHRSRRGPVERYEALPGLPYPPSGPQDLTGCHMPVTATGLRSRESQCGLHAYEGTTMAYDWTGETTRKRTRLKLATAIVVSFAIVLGVPAALSPFI
jgi:hypothetical protein